MLLRVFCVVGSPLIVAIVTIARTTSKAWSSPQHVRPSADYHRQKQARFCSDSTATIRLGEYRGTNLMIVSDALAGGIG